MLFPKLHRLAQPSWEESGAKPPLKPRTCFSKHRRLLRGELGRRWQGRGKGNSELIDFAHETSLPDLGQFDRLRLDFWSIASFWLRTAIALIDKSLIEPLNVQENLHTNVVYNKIVSILWRWRSDVLLPSVCSRWRREWLSWPNLVNVSFKEHRDVRVLVVGDTGTLSMGV